MVTRQPADVTAGKNVILRTRALYELSSATRRGGEGDLRWRNANTASLVPVYTTGALPMNRRDFIAALAAMPALPGLHGEQVATRAPVKPLTISLLGTGTPGASPSDPMISLRGDESRNVLSYNPLA